MKNIQLIDVITLLLIILFTYTGLSKLVDYTAFKGALLKLTILKPYATIFTIVVPSIELIVSLLLAQPKCRRLGIYLSFGLMMLFTGYVGFILAFSKKLPCSCGGVIQRMTWQQHLYFNILFLLVSFIAVVLEAKGKKQIKVLNESRKSEIAFNKDSF